MKAYKVTLLIVDHDRIGDGISTEIENAHYGNDCIRPSVMDIQSADIGEWTDAHPLNQRDTIRGEYERLFMGGAQ